METFNQPADIKPKRKIIAKTFKFGILLAFCAAFLGATYLSDGFAFFGGKTPTEIQNEMDAKIIEYTTELRDMEIERLQARKRYSKKKIKTIQAEINELIAQEKDFTQQNNEIQALNDHIQVANEKISHMNSGRAFFDVQLSESENNEPVGK